MWNTIFKKIIIALISTLILCLVLSIIGYTPEDKQEPNSSYMTFKGRYTLYFIFAAPMFLTVGVLLSILIESKFKNNFVLIFSYAISGGIAGLLYYFLIIVIQVNSRVLGDGIILFLSVGLFAALLFYVVQLILSPLFSKLKMHSD